MRYFVEVHAAGLPAQRHEVSSGTGTVGSGAEDVVAVAPSLGLGAAALQLDVSDGGVLVTASESVDLIVQGDSCRTAELVWGEDLYVSNVRFSFVAEGGTTKKVSPVIPAAGVIALVVAAGFLAPLGKRGDARAAPPAPDFSLQASEAEASSCAANTPDAAVRQAESSMARAVAEHERYPFSRSAGVVALSWISRAEACFKASGKTEALAETLRLRTTWGSEVRNDFGALFITLEKSLKSEDDAAALVAVQAMESMAQAEPSAASPEYKSWLQGLKEQLEQRLGKK